MKVARASVAAVGVVLALCLVMFAGCPPLQAGEVRGALTYSDLAAADITEIDIVDHGWFLPVGEWDSPNHRLGGTLTQVRVFGDITLDEDTVQDAYTRSSQLAATEADRSFLGQEIETLAEDGAIRQHSLSGSTSPTRNSCVPIVPTVLGFDVDHVDAREPM